VDFYLLFLNLRVDIRKESSIKIKLNEILKFIMWPRHFVPAKIAQQEC
jgi:hypothetical protein